MAGISGFFEKVKCAGSDFYHNKVNTKNAGGAAALITAVAMLAIAAVLASGMFGGGAMFFVSAGLIAASLVPFCLSAYALCPPMKYSTIGSRENALKAE